MSELIIGPLLRHVGETTATIWMETDGPCTVEVLGHSTHTFHVAGHHYALVIVGGLQPGTRHEYDVRVDGVVRWPDAALGLPASSVRTLRPPALASEHPLRILFGSCRIAAPHEPPWTLQLAHDPRGRGVDAIYAHARRMAARPVDEWADLLVFLGDQMYADDSSPQARRRIEEKRRVEPADERLPPELVDGFEEFTWLYHESWSSPWERWLLSVVPSVMIFDDHEMIDDWNISASWVSDIRRERWWQQHVTGGLMTYWIYQHLGNQSPDDIASEGMLAALLDADDGASLLRAWAMNTDERTPVDGGYRFSFARHLGRTKLVIVDSRCGRVLEPDQRSMIDEVEWEWIVDQCHEDVDHLLIGTSLPAFTPGGLHDVEVWSDAVGEGAWGRRPAGLQQRAMERVRRGLDLEDWPAFSRSFDALVGLIAAIGRGEAGRVAPASICVLSGDIHFSYQAEIHYPASQRMDSRVHQLVSSPIRNTLTSFERFGMRVMLTRPMTFVGRALRRAARRRRADVRWKIDHGPLWANGIGQLVIEGRSARARFEQSSPDGSGAATLTTAFDIDLTG